MKYLVYNVLFLIFIIVILFIPYSNYIFNNINNNNNYNNYNEYFIEKTPYNIAYLVSSNPFNYSLTGYNSQNNSNSRNNNSETSSQITQVIPIKYSPPVQENKNSIIISEEKAVPVEMEIIQSEVNMEKVQTCNNILSKRTSEIETLKAQQVKAQDNLTSQQQLIAQETSLQNNIIQQEYKRQLNSIQIQSRNATNSLNNIKSKLSNCTSNIKSFNLNFNQSASCCSSQTQNIADTKQKIYANCTVPQNSLNNNLALVNSKINMVQQEISQIQTANAGLTNQINACG